MGYLRFLPGLGFIGVILLSVYIGAVSGDFMAFGLSLIILVIVYVMFLGTWNLSGKALKALDNLSGTSQHAIPQGMVVREHPEASIEASEVAPTKYCIECGMSIRLRVLFCPDCGMKQP